VEIPDGFQPVLLPPPGRIQAEFNEGPKWWLRCGVSMTHAGASCVLISGWLESGSEFSYFA
jgi:hypothetical protein